MDFVIGRGEGGTDLPTATLGRYRALDGSSGAPLGFDLDGPHAALVVGKRGYGKSYTLGVLAEGLARTAGVAPVLVDPMGVFDSLAEDSTGEPVPATVLDSPTVAPDSLDPRSWCELLGLSPESGPGGLVWRAAQEQSSLTEMSRSIEHTDAPHQDKQAAINHVELARSWDIFDKEGIDAATLGGPEVSVVDVSHLDTAPMNAVCRGVGEALYRARVDEEMQQLPWLLLDEAHTFFGGVAHTALATILTRGRAPGVSLVSATQRPSSVPEVAISQSDILLSHRLTSQEDIQTLEQAQPTYMNESLHERMPTAVGEVVIVDDATETVHAAQIRERDTPHAGDSPSVNDRR